MKASATSDFSPPDSSDRRFVDLPAGVTSISTPASGCSSSVALRPPAPRRRASGSLAADTGAGPLRLHEPQPAAAAREQVLHDLLEVLRGRLEGLLERLADAPVGLLDQALELRQRGLEVLALVSSSSTCATASSYSCLASGFTGPSCSRRRASARPSPQLLALLVGQRLGRGLGARARAWPAISVSSRSASAAESRTCCAGTSACVTASLACLQPRLDLGLLLRARAQLGGGPLAGRRAGLELSASASRRGRRPPRGALERVGCPLGAAASARSALGAGASAASEPRARSARSRSARSASRARRAGRLDSSARRTAAGPSSGASRRRSISHSARRTSSSASSSAREARAQRALGAPRAAESALGHGARVRASASRAAASSATARSEAATSSSRRPRSSSIRSSPPAGACAARPWRANRRARAA